MSVWVSLIIFIIAFIIIRKICIRLRGKYQVLDWIGYILIIVASIIVWIFFSWWKALLVFIIGFYAVYWLFLSGSKETIIRRGGKECTLECTKCGYDDLEIIDDNYSVVTTRCKRCGKVTTWTLNGLDD
ncbi:MAG: hypothetical protein J6L02_04240 [Bacteroidales bacterium]|nr:hypothetical protein [Bacteroidales bacterium]